MTALNFMEMNHLRGLLDDRAIPGVMVAEYRATYLECLIQSMSRDIPGVAEYMRQRIEILQKDAGKPIAPVPDLSYAGNQAFDAHMGY